MIDSAFAYEKYRTIDRLDSGIQGYRRMSRNINFDVLTITKIWIENKRHYQILKS